MRTRIEQTRIVAASAFCIGASYYALIDTEPAKIVYWAAAHAYRDLGMSYGAILAICAADTPLEEEYWGDLMARKTIPELSPTDAAPTMLVAADMLVRDRAYAQQARSIINSSRGMEGALIGSAQIPMGFYHALAEHVGDIARGDITSRRAYVDAALGFLAAWGQRLQLVQLDRFHWNHLHAQLLPVEPEVLAASIIIVKAARRAEFNIQRAVDDADLAQNAKVPLDVAVELAADDRRNYPRVDDPVLRSLYLRRYG
ncbi:MAG TPA: hypothetical protein VFE35_00750 [Candidatus Cybelea sp.]|nr:hypothetical protein [Candidatus Cybelea sp.]